MSQLPQGWVFSKLGEIVDIISGVGFPKHAQGRITGDFPFAKVSDISRAVLSNQNVLEDATNYIEEGDLKSLHAKLIPPGSTVFAKIGEALRLNRRAITKRTLVIDNNCMALTPNAKRVVPEYLFRFMMTVDLSPLAVATAIPSVRRDDIAQLDIPLPPTIEEQRRIVARLDTLLAQSKAARAELNKALALAKRQRQAVLAKAFSGELTQDWRDKQLFPSQTLAFTRDGIDGRVSEFNELPSHWSWTSINEVFVISGGLTKNSKRNNLPIRVPYLRVANVYANELRLSEIENIGCTETELTKTVLQKGDLLIVEGNGSIDQLGRVALWNNEIDRCSHQNHLIRARPTSIVLPKYGLFWLLSPEGRNYIEKVGSSSSGLHTLSISKVGGLPIPMCSLEEQKEIVKRIEAAFAQIETMENEAKKALALAERLEQATLAKAFQGQL